MTDISKCNNCLCKIRDKCYRFRAAIGEYQAMIIIDHPVNSSKDCGGYWEVLTEDRIKELDKIWQD